MIEDQRCADETTNNDDMIVDAPTLIQWLRVYDLPSRAVIPVEPPRTEWQRWFVSQGYLFWPRG